MELGNWKFWKIGNSEIGKIRFRLRSGGWRLENGGWSLNFPFKGVDQAPPLVPQGLLFRPFFSVSKKGIKNEALESGFGSPNRAKIDAKMENTLQNRCRHRAPFFDRLLIDCRSLWVSKMEAPNPLFLPRPFVLLYGNDSAVFRQEAIF